MNTFKAMAVLFSALGAQFALAGEPFAGPQTDGPKLARDGALGSEVTGGWGLNCQTSTIRCDASGRELGCSAQVGSAYNRSECIVNWGTTGWVSCAVYDRAGYVLASFTDQCP